MAQVTTGGRRDGTTSVLGCGPNSDIDLTQLSLAPSLELSTPAEIRLPLLWVGVEAQAGSAWLAARSVALLPDAPPIEIVRRDLREVTAEEDGTFDLVTGSPPYFPLGTGVLQATQFVSVPQPAKASAKTQ